MSDTLEASPLPHFAFRCKQCGHLHTSDDAGEATHPHACRVCGGGVSFHPRTGIKTLDPTNWEKAVDMSDERLLELGLEKHQVHAHKPAPAGKTGNANIQREASEGTAVADKGKSH